MKPNLPDDLQSRILQLLDGDLEEKEAICLDAELLGNREARVVYLQLAALHSALEERYASQACNHGTPVVPIERLLARQRQRIVKGSLLAAAALLIITAVTLWLQMAPRSPAALASFRLEPGSSFTLTHADEDDAPVGNLLRKGSRLHLTRGTVEGVFNSGARCVVKAPCVLSVLAEDRISINEGVAWFEIPPAAISFKVETPQLSIVDLGTEFGVLALADSPHEVHVTKGSVEITSRLPEGTRYQQTLKAGQARRWDAHGKLVHVAYDADRFTTSLPESIAIKNPNFDAPVGDTGGHDPDGYGPITHWATSGAGVGTSSNSQPFLKQPAHSGTHAAFIQGHGIIAQSVSGFDPSKLYTVTYFVSERGLPGAATRTSVSLDLGTNFYSPPGNILKTDAFRRIVSGPLAVFGPTANIEIRAATVSGDAALLVDTVSVSRAVPAVPDGGFENAVQGSKHFKQATGTGLGDLRGSTWDIHAGGGILSNGSNFLSPKAPEGSQAAVLQSEDARLSTTVHGFEEGVTYTLSLEAAGRRHEGTAPIRVMLDGQPVLFGDVETLTPTIGSYTTFTSDGFTPGKETLILSIEATGPGTSFIDDLRFNFVAEATDPPADGE